MTSRVPAIAASSCLACALVACSQSSGPSGVSASSDTTFGSTTTSDPTLTGASMTGSTDSSTTTGTGTGTDSGASTGGSTGEKLDTPEPPLMGCNAVDILFVVDNSASMQTYQQALASEFPAFVDAMWDALPSNLSLHVGITTTDFDNACDASEVTQDCQSTADANTINTHYVKPTTLNDGGNGTQGRLFEWNQMRYFETMTGQDSADLKTWFSGAATAAGENGCSFEMPVAAAGWAMDPANDATNQGFVRDAGALLVIFFLTDEPDKSPDSKSFHEGQVLAVKQDCGGADCVYAAGLVPPCVSQINQKLWQFMTLWDDMPNWGDIMDTPNYSQLVGASLADAVNEACMKVPPVG